jgi:hypothetical protein
VVCASTDDIRAGIRHNRKHKFAGHKKGAALLKVFIGVVRFKDEREFIIMVDGEPQPVEDAVRQVMSEIWGDGEVSILAEGVDFIEFIHPQHAGKDRADGYVLGCEVGSHKRIGFAIQNARRLRALAPGDPPTP